MRLRLGIGLLVLGLMGWAAACSSSDSGNGTTDGGPGGDDGSSTGDGSIGDDGSTGDDGSAQDSAQDTGGDGAKGDGGAGDASDAPLDVYVAPPTLVAISPGNGSIGAGFVLCADVSGALAGARVLYNGTALTPVTPDAGASDGGDAGDAGGVTTVCGTVPANAVAIAGSIAVQVENAPGNVGSRSGPFYVQIAQTDGGPEVYDLHTDNAPGGQPALLVGKNLGGTLTLNDPQDASTTASSDGGTLFWPSVGTSETAGFTVPASGWQTGQITVSGSAGAPFRTRVFNVGTNLAPGSTASASTEYPGWPVSKIHDNDLRTSWFSANGDCASSLTCTSIPTVVLVLAAPKSIHRISIRGNREYTNGYDVFRGRLEVLGDDPTDAGDAGARPVLFSRSLVFQGPMRDADLIVSPPVMGNAVRFVSEEDESIEPGVAEIEVFEN